MRVKLTDLERADRHLWRQFRRRNEQRKIPYEFDCNSYSELCRKPCAHCGCWVIRRVRTNGHSANGFFPVNGLDKKDPKIKKYTTDNSVPCCYICQYMRGSRPLLLFKQYLSTLQRLYKYGIAFADILTMVTVAYKAPQQRRFDKKGVSNNFEYLLPDWLECLLGLRSNKVLGDSATYDKVMKENINAA